MGSIHVDAGVDDRHAGEHVLVVDPLAERGSGGGELDARVDALGLRRVGGDEHADAIAGGHDPAHGVGEVELTLRVRRLQLVERRPERVRAEHVDGRVRFLDRELLGARVRGLDDGNEVPRLVADDAAVAADVVRHEREDRGRGARASVGVDERGEELGRQERRVAGEDEHLLRVADRPARRAHGIARPERALLHRDLQPVEGGGAVRRGDDDEGRGTERLGSRHDPVDHPPPEDRVEVLRDRGAHTRPQPSGHHDCSESRRHHESSMAGAPGFEPGITGPKPVALPLGHAPAQGNGSLPGLPAVEQKGREGDCRARDHCHGREHDDGAGQHRHEHDDQL